MKTSSVRAAGGEIINRTISGGRFSEDHRQNVLQIFFSRQKNGWDIETEHAHNLSKLDKHLILNT